MSYLREEGVIDSVFLGHEDHNIPTFTLGIAFDGAHQGFGMLTFESLNVAREFAVDVCRVFGDDVVQAFCEGDRPSILKGRKVIALRCFDRFGETIEAIEDPATGGRFVLFDWRRAHWPDTKDPLTEGLDRIHSSVVAAQRRIADLIVAYRKLPDAYHPIGSK